MSPWPRLPSRAASGFLVLLQLGSVLMSVAQVTTKAKWISVVWAATKVHVAI